MVDSNPYSSAQNSNPQPLARGRQLSSALMGIGFLLMGVALYIFFFAESFTFYTPYSVESGGWILHLPNGIDYSINSYVGVSMMIGCAHSWHLASDDFINAKNPLTSRPGQSEDTLAIAKIYHCGDADSTIDEQ